MTAAAKTVIYPVDDLEETKTLFGALLGTAPTMDQPYYVGFDTPGLHIGLDPNGAAKGMTGPVAYWHVDDVAATMKALESAGAHANEAINDVGGGKLVASMKDSSGNVIGLIQDA